MLKRNLDNLSEAKLLDLFYKEKNSKALGVLLNQYLPYVFAICNYYLKDREKAKDASSDIMEKMLKYFQIKQVNNPKGLVAIAAKNYCLSQLKKEKPTVDIDAVAYKLEEDNQIDQKILQESKLKQLEESLDQLKASQSRCIRLFYLDKKSYQQISDETGLNIKQVKSDIQNGKRMLRNLLTEKMNHGNE